MRSLLALLIIAAFLFNALRSHYVAMLNYWWFGIFRPQEWMYLDVSAYRLPLLAAIVFMLPLLFTKKLPAITDNITKLIILLCVFAAIAAVTGGCDFAIPFNFTTTAILLAATLFTCRVLEKPYQIVTLLMVAGISLSYHTAKSGLLTSIGGGTIYTSTLVGGGAFAGSNAMAMGSAMGVFFWIFAIQCLVGNRFANFSSFFVNRNTFRLLLIGISVASIVGGVLFILLVGSRGTTLALILGTTIWVLLHPRRFSMGIIFVVVVVVGLGVSGQGDSVVERLSTVFVEEEDLDYSAVSRPHYWKVARIMAANNPTGIGVGCYRRYYSKYDTSGGDFGQNRSVHSSHFSVLSELGYGGFIAWVLLFITCYARLWTIRRNHISAIKDCGKSLYYVNFSHAIMAALAVFLFGGSFYELAYNDYLWLIFACIVAVSKERFLWLHRHNDD